MPLTAGARVVNTGLKWNEGRTALMSWGGSPTMIEPVTGKVILRNLEKAGEVRVAALDGAGRPIGKPINARRTRDGWEIEIGEPASTWYEVTVERASASTGAHFKSQTSNLKCARSAPDQSPFSDARAAAASS